MSTSWIDIAPGSAGFSGYLALPPAGSGPGLVLFQEIFGVNPHIRAVAEQYAMDGFVVLAPDVFWRQAPRIELGYVGEQRQRGVELATALQPAELLGDLKASVAALRARPEVGANKVGCFGYCLGGRLSYLTAASTDVDAAAAFYGGGIHGMLDRAAGIRCPMQFHYAEHDDHIPLSAVEQVRAAMAVNPGGTEVLVYPGSQHGFNCWARATYQPRAAALAHGRTTAFFAKHLF